MLKGLQKRFFNVALEEGQKEEVTMSEKEDGTKADLNVDMAAVQASLSAVTEQLADATKQLKEQGSQIAELSTALATATKFKMDAEAQAKEVKMATRKEKIVMAVGTGNSDALFAATENLGDSEFSAIIGAMTTSLNKEADSKMFNEKGVEGQADKNKLAEENNLLTMLEHKYSKKQ